MAWSKESPESRGYGPAWKRLRLEILRRDGYVCQCEGCKASGRVLDATHCDHILSKAQWFDRHGNLDGVDHPSNLQAMNADCHKLKTMLEKGGQPRFGATVSGWPRDPEHPWNRR